MKIDSLHVLNGMFSDFPSILLASCQLALYDLIQLSPMNIWFFVSFVPPRRRSPTYRSSFPCPSLSPPPSFSSLSGLSRLAVVDCSLTPKPSNWNDEMKDTWRDHDYYSYKLLVTVEYFPPLPTLPFLQDGAPCLLYVITHLVRRLLHHWPNQGSKLWQQNNNTVLWRCI